jgi:hypothetical protein
LEELFVGPTHERFRSHSRAFSAQRFGERANPTCAGPGLAVGRFKSRSELG